MVKIYMEIKRRISATKAMSIIELMVAVTILAIGILSIAGLVPSAMRTMTNMRLRTKGVDYAQQQMEVLKRLGFTGLPPSAGVGTIFTSSVINPSQDTQYRLWWQVTADVNSQIFMRKVIVYTTWGPNFRDTIKIDSYFSR